MEGGKEQNFWPGFVDALSNVVLVMIFVVVVFVVTLFYYSQKLAQIKALKLIQKRDLVEEVVAPTKRQPRAGTDEQSDPDAQRVRLDAESKSEEIKLLKNRIVTLEAKLSKNSSNANAGSMQSDEGVPNKTIEVLKSTKSPSTDTAPGVKVERQNDSITLRFDSEGVELTPDAIKLLDANLSRWVDRLKGQQGKLVITGVVASVSYTEGRRRAYYRTIAIRNHLLDLGVPAVSLVSRVVPGEESAENDAKVVIQYVAGGK
ncbi:hypothetical protein RGU70_09410 [Herbaspirillum sp. RTI4]|uniref:hypothetical protein n=1 Tax=Herbaspirillum sp. RTI4 TaxID=3048640 RepID=UPI002AB3DE41|nr:hypothetical protein [Herbaspirillum sp. RTI4]MDY7578539.1 hypothetical protein [Herbaspirillum sp. RTI4]MEA9983457.1 hypothetical protein [Herbaspirillum sp. RTI4]